MERVGFELAGGGHVPAPAVRSGGFTSPRPLSETGVSHPRAPVEYLSLNERIAGVGFHAITRVLCWVSL